MVQTPAGMQTISTPEELMHRRVAKRRWGGVIAALGVLIIVAEVVYTGFFLNETPRWTMILIGSGIGFVGFFMLDPRGAHEGGDLLVGYGVKIIGAVRGGRRSTDQMVAVVEPTGVVAASIPTPRVEIPVRPRISAGGDLYMDDERGEFKERAP